MHLITSHYISIRLTKCHNNSLLDAFKKKRLEDMEQKPSKVLPSHSITAVLYWLIEATSAAETIIRLNYLRYQFPVMFDYLKNLERLQHYWTSWSGVWTFSLLLRASSIVENWNHTLKALEKEMLIPLEILPNHVRTAALDRKLATESRITYAHLKLSDLVGLHNMVSKASIDEMQRYLSEEGIPNLMSIFNIS